MLNCKRVVCKNCEQFYIFPCRLFLSARCFFANETEEKGSPPQSSLNILSSRLSLSLIWLALFAYHLTARLRIKYSAFSMKMNMYVHLENLFFFGFNRLKFRLCLCVQCCQFLAVKKSHFSIYFYFVSLSLISPNYLPDDFECKTMVFSVE